MTHELSIEMGGPSMSYTVYLTGASEAQVSITVTTLFELLPPGPQY